MTGIPATTSVLALNELPGLLRVREVGLVSAYFKGVNDAIRKHYTGVGSEVTSERETRLSITRNSDFANVSAVQLDEMVSEVVKEEAKVVIPFCMNL